MRNWQRTLLASCLLLFGIPAFGQGKTEKGNPSAVQSDLSLKKAERVKLCRDPHSPSRPFFRVVLDVISQGGKPQGITMDDQTLRDRTKVQGIEGTSQAREKFEVLDAHKTGQTVTTAAPGRTILLLFDISGSMVGKKNLIQGKKRLEVAQDGAKVLLENFRDGTDRIAIVPFESHKVEEGIKNVPFASSRTAAEAQINQLSQPNPQHANTALYSATLFALNKLQQEQGEGRMLIVLTDGRNEVEEGDDAHLLGEEGRARVKEKAEQVGISILTIGFGKEVQDYDAEVLKEMAYPTGRDNFHPAQSAADLKNILVSAEQALSNRLTVTFFPTTICDYRDIKKLDFEVVIGSNTSKPISWSPTGTSGTLFEAELEPDELRALSNPSFKAYCDKVALGPWQRFLRPFGFLALFSGGFALLWFLPPRLLWPRLNVPQVPSKLKLPGRLSQKKAPTPIPPKPRPSAAAGNVPAKPRQRFEETRIFEDRDLKS